MMVTRRVVARLLDGDAWSPTVCYLERPGILVLFPGIPGPDSGNRRTKRRIALSERSRVPKQPREPKVHVELVMTVKQAQAGVVGNEVHVHPLPRLDQDRIL